jgi:hypothetical protein
MPVTKSRIDLEARCKLRLHLRTQRRFIAWIGTKATMSKEAQIRTLRERNME